MHYIDKNNNPKQWPCEVTSLELDETTGIYTAEFRVPCNLNYYKHNVRISNKVGMDEVVKAFEITKKVACPSGDSGSGPRNDYGW
jgi:hypothetical protein